MNSDGLEERRQMLVARITLQRLELRRRVAQASAHGPAAVTLRALRLAGTVARWWGIGRLAWRLVRAIRRKPAR